MLRGDISAFTRVFGTPCLAGAVGGWSGVHPIGVNDPSLRLPSLIASKWKQFSRHAGLSLPQIITSLICPSSRVPFAKQSRAICSILFQFWRRYRDACCCVVNFVVTLQDWRALPFAI
jgi:hypothetical protein